MNYPIILIERPHQRRASVHPVFSLGDLINIADRRAGDNFESDHPEHSEEWCLDAIRHDLYGIDVIESPEECAEYLRKLRQGYAGHNMPPYSSVKDALELIQAGDDWKENAPTATKP